MANSRLLRLGTIFDRVTSLVKTGCLKKEDRPIWYDVYRVFPPFIEPSYANASLQANPTIKEIFYPEDVIRAKFHQKMFRKLPAEDLMMETTTDVTRRAIDLTNKLMQENEKLTVDEAVNQTIDVFKTEGLFFVKRSTRPSRVTRKFSVNKNDFENSYLADEFESTTKNITDKKIDIASILNKKEDGS